MSRRKKSTSLHRFRILFSRRYLGWTVAGTLLVITVALTELRVLLIGPAVASQTGWIIDGNQLDDLVSYLPSALPKTFFGSSKTFVLKPDVASDGMIPGGWHSHSGIHYTSFASAGCSGDCASLQADLAGNPQPAKHQFVMFDDEHWDKTPVSEQRNPCGAMQSFVTAAHARNFETIMAPDQNLGQPGVISYYQGGESENWQTYLRLGLGACAAKSGSDWYHIMSQPFEAHWCGNPLGQCQS